MRHSPQSILNSQVVHVDIWNVLTLDVGHAPVRAPKYSALFLAQPLGPRYKGAPPKPRVWITLLTRIVTGLW